MRKLLLLILLVIAGWLVWKHYFAKPPPVPTAAPTPASAPSPAPTPAVKTYAPQMETLVTMIVSDLGAGPETFQKQAQEISGIQSALRTDLAGATEREKAVIGQAQNLAKSLQIATEERLENERILARRIADPARNMQLEIDEAAQESFLKSHKNRWAARAKVWKQKLESLLVRLQAAERAPTQ